MANITETLLTDVKHKKDFVKEDAPGGDLTTISGLDNLKEAVLRRIVTEPGSLSHRPDYGVGLKQFQNAPNSLSTQRELANRIVEQLGKERRVAKVNSISITASNTEAEKVFILINVTPVGYDEEIPVEIPFGEVF